MSRERRRVSANSRRASLIKGRPWPRLHWSVSWHALRHFAIDRALSVKPPPIMTSATRSPTPVPLLILTLLVLVVSASRALPHYEAPTDCEWHWLNVTADTATAIDTQVALHCHLRTINSQFDQTDFSVIARDYTSRLHIECSHSLLYLSALMADGLAHLHHLRHLTIEFCKLQKVLTPSMIVSR